MTATTLNSPSSLTPLPAGLAETARCDLEPVDADRGQVTYTTSQVSEGCVAETSSASLEVHVLFLEFPTVSVPCGEGAGGPGGGCRLEER